MPLNSQGYFNCLKSYLNLSHYAIAQNDRGKILLKETIYTATGQVDQKITLNVRGDALVIKLDAKNSRGNCEPLFHFLDDNAKPWSKRCDFVIFQNYQQKLRVYCIEFKSETFPENLADQLKSSVSWCKSLHDTIKNYTGQSKKLSLTKYLFSCHPNPSVFLDTSGKYLRRDHSIRHYHYNEVNNMNLEDFDNETVEEIR